MKSFSISDMTELGIPEVDLQHRKILHFIKDMGRAIGTKDEREVLQATIRRMIDYSVMHFSYENVIMKGDRYPEISEHQKLHGAFNEKIKDLVDRFGKPGELKADEVVSWLWDWWMDHIQVHDRIWVTEHVAKNIKD